MILARLHLDAFGPFTDQIVELSDEPALVLICGPNEAGKSSALRAILDLLFGFPHRTTDDFIHQQRDLRIGGHIIDSNGEVLHIYRRKGRRDTLRDSNDQPLDDAVLQRAMGITNRVLFEQMFGLDRDRLRQGGTDMLQGHGEVGLSLFEASAGIVGLHDILAELDDEGRELFLPRGQKKINVSAKRLSGLRREEREAYLSSEHWEVLIAKLKRTEEELDGIGEQILRLMTDRVQLDRIQRNLPLIAERAELQDALRELEEIPDLPEQNREIRIDAERNLDITRAALTRAGEEIEGITQEIDGLTVRDELLVREEEIRALAERRGAVRKAENDLPERDGEVRVQRAEVNRLLTETGSEVPIERVREILPARPDAASIRELIQRHGVLVTRREEAIATVDEANITTSETQDQLEQIGEVLDPAPFEGVLDAVAPTVSKEPELIELQTKARALGDDVSDRITALPLWEGSAKDVAMLLVPSKETVRRFAERIRADEDHIGLTSDIIAKVQEDLARAIADLEDIEAAGELPTEEGLEEVRERRERGWRLIRLAFVDGNEEVTEEAQLFDAERPLPEAYEASVAEADALADSLRKEGERVHRKLALEIKRKRDEEALEQHQRTLAETQDLAQHTIEEWQTQWEVLRTNPLSPEEMLAWLENKDEIVDLARGLNIKLEQIIIVEKQVAQARARLSKVLVQLGETEASQEEDLNELIARARSAIRALRRSRQIREGLLQQISEAEARYRTAQKRIETIERDFETWRKEWTRSVETLGRSKDATPAEINSLLDLFDDLSRALQVWEGTSYRIERMREDITAFDHDVAELVKTVAPEIEELPGIEASLQLSKLLDQAKREQERLEDLRQNLERYVKESAQHQSEIQDKEHILKSLCQAAGCENLEELKLIEERSSAKREKTERLREVEHRLVAGSGGLRLDGLVAETEGANVDDLPGRIQQIEYDLTELQGQRDGLNERRGELKERREAMDGADTAAKIAQEAESEIATIRELADQYSTVSLGAAILRHGIERYRQMHQGPLLMRAGELFARMTENSFEQLVVDTDDRGQLIIVGVRPGGQSVGVDGMSEGVCSQLFLALRLAAIEEHIHKGITLPFIADDILIDFDDSRSEAAFTVLGELATNIQVIYFTHHNHMIELARRSVPENRLVVRELE